MYGGYSNDVGMIQVLAIVFLLLLAVVPAKIAQTKGYSFLFYYIFSVCFFLFALVVSLILKNKNEKHTQMGQTETIEMYEQKYERGEISYNDFVSKKRELAGK